MKRLRIVVVCLAAALAFRARADRLGGGSKRASTEDAHPGGAYGS